MSAKPAPQENWLAALQRWYVTTFFPKGPKSDESVSGDPSFVRLEGEPADIAVTGAPAPHKEIYNEANDGKPLVQRAIATWYVFVLCLGGALLLMASGNLGSAFHSFETTVRRASAPSPLLPRRSTPSPPHRPR